MITQDKTNMISPKVKKSSNFNLMELMNMVFHPLDHLNQSTQKILKMIENLEKILNTISKLKTPVNQIFDLIDEVRTLLNHLKQRIKNIANID